MNEKAPERAAMWDARYEPASYAYGEAANAFLVAQAPRFKPGMRALVPGDGEGRNGVWLAQQGLVVDTLDLSAQGVAKARRLAAARGVSVNAAQADALTWTWPRETKMSFHPSLSKSAIVGEYPAIGALSRAMPLAAVMSANLPLPRFRNSGNNS